MADPPAERAHPIRALWRAIAFALALPFAVGVVGIFIAVVISSRKFVRSVLKERIQTPWGRLKMALRLFAGGIAILIGLPLVVVIYCIQVLRSPSDTFEDLKSGRKVQRDWRRLREQGRVLSWEEAKKRLDQMLGTFIVIMDEGELMGVWWIKENRATIDPETRMPSLTDEEYKPLLESDLVRVKAAAANAYWVEEPTDLSPVGWLNALSDSPNIELAGTDFESAALRGPRPIVMTQ